MSSRTLDEDSVVVQKLEILGAVVLRRAALTFVQLASRDEVDYYILELMKCLSVSCNSFS